MKTTTGAAAALLLSTALIAGCETTGQPYDPARAAQSAAMIQAGTALMLQSRPVLPAPRHTTCWRNGAYLNCTTH